MGKLPGLRALLGPYFLATVAMTAYSVFYMYCDFRYHWTPLDVGMFMTLGGLGAGIHQGLTVRVVIPALVSEEQAASGGYLLHAFSMVMFGTASQGYMIYVATILLGVHQVADPAMVALMTAIPGPDHKGALQGALLSVRTLAHAVGAPVFGAIFAWCISTDFIKRHGRPLPGAPFLLASAILFITSTLCQRVFYNQRAKKRNDEKLREEAKPLLKDEMQYAAGKAELA
uniref:Major facilitator superfamily (MFS) profile domain-containing protein n=1 Tax=Fibrocapsa japonica TaxID=94617 RepID=A0A6U1QE04_9STRA